MENEIDKNNYLICEFLGLRPEAKGGRVTIDGQLFWCIKRVEGMGGAVYNSRPTLFHKDWNWLMVVVTRIYDLDLYHTKYIEYNSSMVDDGQLKLSTNIQDVYKACLDFIRWYNLNSK